VLDAKRARRLQQDGHENSFRTRNIIMSFHYAARQAEHIRNIPWSLVVMDEAHKLPNSYRQSNNLGQSTQGIE
jgi:superfamily II DNA or RNA helicase